ncbi:family 20 glycosylhydrolase [Brevundimonas sp. VNH65]|uniref:family 20 glycosylhydrolase n=1 Tax=Brevundimonas sp. VNH65 TaxID=3400917 RepID=UPI003C09C7F5
MIRIAPTSLKTRLLGVMAALAASMCAPAATGAGHPGPGVIPQPLSVVHGEAIFRISSATPVLTPPGDAEAAQAAARFIELAKSTWGLTLTATEGAPRSGAVVLRRGSGHPTDGYALDVTADGATITAGDFGGLLYGGVTLWQLGTPQTGATSIAVGAVQIQDAPRFGWRGLMLDSARHYQSPEFIKRFIDWMAAHKLNVFHWHLTDDQAWRLEIKAFPRLTEVGAWRVPAGAAPRADIDPATGRPRLYGGFYTQDTVREIVAYAQARNIVIVPEIDAPGHASAAVAAYPELGVTDAPDSAVPAVPSDWGIYPTLFNTEDATLAFFGAVFDEVMDLFPSLYIHVGGDEAVKDQWKASPSTQARMAALGLHDEEELQSWFIKQLEARLNARGRRLIGWDEILEGGLAPNATVMSWRGVDGAIEAARLGHDAVMTPGPTLYFDYRQSPDDGAPGRSTAVSLRDIYEFDPTPDAMTPDQAKRVLGVQANIFTEHMRDEGRVEYMAFPRTSALAEIAWTAHDRLDWTSFRARLEPQLDRYRALGIRYAESGLREPVTTPPPDGERRYSRQLTMCTEGLGLSLIDDAPLMGERVAFMMDVMNPCWLYKDADLSRGVRFEAAVGQVPWNFQIGAARDNIRLAAPRTPEGELEIRAGGCDGAVVLVLPLTTAAADPGVTVLNGDLPALEGRQDLCLRFTQHQLDPMWGLDWVRLSPAS